MHTFFPTDFGLSSTMLPYRQLKQRYVIMTPYGNQHNHTTSLILVTPNIPHHCWSNNLYENIQPKNASNPSRQTSVKRTVKIGRHALSISFDFRYIFFFTLFFQMLFSLLQCLILILCCISHYASISINYTFESVKFVMWLLIKDLKYKLFRINSSVFFTSTQNPAAFSC